MQEGYINVSFPEAVANDVDSRRGLVPRSTYMQALIRRAIAAGMDTVEDERKPRKTKATA